MTDIEFIFDKLEKILDKQEADFTWYVDNVFSKEEAIRHVDNMYYFLARKEGTLAMLRMELMADGRGEIFQNKELEKQQVIQDLVDQEEKDIERFTNFAKTLLNKDNEKNID